MSDLPVQPNVETLVVGALAAATSLDATFGDRIATRRDEEAGFPFLTLRRTGGARPVEAWLVGASIEFQVWGAQDEEEATETAANLAESVVLGLSGPYASAVVTGVEPIIGPRNVPDPETDWPRYIFEARVFVHPAE